MVVIFSSQAMADWKLTGKEKNMSFYIDENSVKKQGENSMVFWTKSVFKSPRVYERKYGVEKFADEMLSMYNINCDNQTYTYNDGMFKYKGKIVWRYSENNRDTSPKYPEPYSYEMGMVTSMCKIMEGFDENGVTTLTDFNKLHLKKSKQ